MKVVFNDGGREAAGFKGHAGDCVTRAIAIAAELPYTEVYKKIALGNVSQRAGKRGKRTRSANHGVETDRKWFKDYMRSLGFVWTPTMGIGTGCKVHLHDGELPDGRLVVMVSKHACAVIDGVIHDTHDPQRDGVTFERPPGWETMPLKLGYSRNQNGIHHVSRRCVYGYWKKVD